MKHLLKARINYRLLWHLNRVFCMTIAHKVKSISGTQLHIVLSRGQRVSYFVQRALEGFRRAREDTEPVFVLRSVVVEAPCSVLVRT